MVKNKNKRSSSNGLEGLKTLLMPGIGIKRWLLITLAGITLISVGLALLALDIYRNAPNTWWLPILSYASLRVLPRIARVLIFGSAGLFLTIFGIWKLSRALLKPFVRPGSDVVDTITRHRRRERGPKVVVIGGGHGLAMLLRGLKEYTYNLTAIVTVADDGGSSGRLRESMGILPPGDIRNCLAALSNDEALMAQLFQYRFASADKGLDGHSFGNLFISALKDITGSFEDAIAESGRVLSVHGRVLPSTLHDVKLVADIIPSNSSYEIRVKGESTIPQHKAQIRRIWLEPQNPPAYPAAIKALLNADLIVIGPGSLYTSIMPNLLVPDICAAIHASKALRIYVANVATQIGETDGYALSDHIKALEEHCGKNIFEIVVANNEYTGTLLNGMEFVRVDEQQLRDVLIYQTNLTDEDEPWHHSSDKIATILIELLQEKTGPVYYV